MFLLVRALCFPALYDRYINFSYCFMLNILLNSYMKHESHIRTGTAAEILKVEHYHNITILNICMVDGCFDIEITEIRQTKNNAFKYKVKCLFLFV